MAVPALPSPMLWSWPLCAGDIPGVIHFRLVVLPPAVRGPTSPKASITGTGFLRAALGPFIFSFQPQGVVTPEHHPCFCEQVTGGDAHRGGDSCSPVCAGQ